jgi:hypothetical protein
LVANIIVTNAVQELVAHITGLESTSEEALDQVEHQAKDALAEQAITVRLPAGRKSARLQVKVISRTRDSVVSLPGEARV